MAKWVRWWGLIAFVSIVAVVLLFWLVFADGLVKRAVERAGTAMVGAEVDVAAAEVSFFPLGLTLSGIAVTDPASPGFNSVELGRVAFSIDGLEILRRKIIVKEMSVEGMRFDRARTRPGFVVKPPEKRPEEAPGTSFTLPSADLPSAKEVLEKESLASLKIIDETSILIETKTGTWQKRMDELPDKARIDSYRSRVDKLRTVSRSLRLSDAKTLLSDTKDLTRDLNKDLDAVKKAQSDFRTDYSSARDAVDRAVRSPQEDFRKIREKYGLSASGLQNLSRALFGGAVSSWVDRGFLWYGRLKPLFAGSGEKKGTATVVKPLRAKGVDVRFREDRPLPGLLVRLVKASMQPPSGSFGGEIRNITPEQGILGNPLTFSFSGAGLPDIASIKLTGTLDHVRPAASSDSASAFIQGYKFADMTLPGNASLPLTMKEGLADISVSGSYDGTSIKAHVKAVTRSVRFLPASGTPSAGVAAAITAALQKVDSFTLSADISGTPGDYDMKMISDLDRVLKDAAGRALGDKIAKFEKDLSSAIRERTGDKLKGLQGGLGGLGSLGGKIDGVQEQLSGLLRDATSAGGKTKLPF